MEFFDYCWKDGRPVGMNPVQGKTVPPRVYKIVTDPYRKRWTIEKYTDGVFDGVVYDSGLFDFRRLKNMETEPWERILLSKTTSREISLLRDPDDRPIAKEVFFFKKGRQVRCEIWSVHDRFLCSHILFCTEWGDSWNGLVLSDSERKPILWKEYAIDETTQEFTTLLKESWNPYYEPLSKDDCL